MTKNSDNNNNKSCKYNTQDIVCRSYTNHPQLKHIQQNITKPTEVQKYYILLQVFK